MTPCSHLGFRSGVFPPRRQRRRFHQLVPELMEAAARHRLELCETEENTIKELKNNNSVNRKWRTGPAHYHSTIMAHFHCRVLVRLNSLFIAFPLGYRLTGTFFRTPSVEVTSELKICLASDVKHCRPLIGQRESSHKHHF